MKKRAHTARQSKRTKRRFMYVFGLVFILAAIYFLSFDKSSQDSTSSSETNNTAATHEIEKKGILKKFTGAEFRDLYNSFAYPNSAYINETTPITGNEAADARIRSLAEKRGYIKRSAPVADTFREVGGMLLQERAAASWIDLKKAASIDGFQLSLTAAYRSADEQKEIFLNRLGGISLEAIASGKVDGQINELLRTTAVPGYSRHHTGYTVDIGCPSDPSVVFEASSCFAWLSQNNYQHTKENGWIPSYPDGAGRQGPDPESWEYVWVGKDVLTE